MASKKIKGVEIEMKKRIFDTFHLILLLVIISVLASNFIDMPANDDSMTVAASGYEGLNLSDHPVKNSGYYENNTEIFLTKVGNTDFTVVRGYISFVKMTVPERSVLAEIPLKGHPATLERNYTLCRAELDHMTVPKSSGDNLMEIVFAGQDKRKIVVNMTVIGENASQNSLPVLKVLPKEDKEKLSLY